jgi:hypothetical protein
VSGVLDRTIGATKPRLEVILDHRRHRDADQHHEDREEDRQGRV